MKYVCLFLLGATCFCGKLAAGPNPGTLSLWYDRPASRWEEALPLGNGRLGAMVYGHTGIERIQLNEDSLWSSGPMERNNRASLGMLPTIPKKVLAGKMQEAVDLMSQYMFAAP